MDNTRHCNKQPVNADVLILTCRSIILKIDGTVNALSIQL